MRSFSVRPATDSDLEDCIWLDRQESLTPADGARHRAVIASRIASGDIVLATDDENKPVGYIRFDLLWPMLLPTLGWVYVKPDWRSSGIMAGLYQAGLDLLHERGHQRFMMSTQSNRQTVMDLFRTMGLQECGRLSVHADGVSEVFYLGRL